MYCFQDNLWRSSNDHFLFEKKMNETRFNLIFLQIIIVASSKNI